MTTIVSVRSSAQPGLVTSVLVENYNTDTNVQTAINKHVVENGETREFTVYPGQLVTVEEMTPEEHDQLETSNSEA